MPTDTPVVERNAAADRVTGLDALELGGRTDRDPLAARVWRSAWPKLLAVGIVIGAWQAVVAAGLKPEYVLPGPAEVFDELGAIVTTGEFWDAVRLTMTRAIIGFSSLGRRS